MTRPTEDTLRLLDQLQAGHGDAHNALIVHAHERLLNLAKKMLRSYPGVGRFEQPEDVLQNALIRMNRALMNRKFDSSLHFWNLAALQIRRELIDLARHYFGPRGQESLHHTDGGGKAPDDPGGPLQIQASAEGEPSSLEEWSSFHEAVEKLPEEERTVFSLVYYDGLTRQEAAKELGVSLSTVKLRWQKAQLLLDRAMRH